MPEMAHFKKSIPMLPLVNPTPNCIPMYIVFVKCLPLRISNKIHHFKEKRSSVSVKNELLQFSKWDLAIYNENICWNNN